MCYLPISILHGPLKLNVKVLYIYMYQYTDKYLGEIKISL